MKRKIPITAVILISLFLCLWIAKNQLVKAAVIKSATKLLGAKVQIDSLSFSLLKRKIEIKGLKVYNPQGFPNEVMLDIPEIMVLNYDLGALMQGKVHLNVVKINLREATIIRAKDKKLNVDSFKVIAEAKKDKNSKPVVPKQKKGTLPLKVEHLTMNIGRVIFKDSSGAGTPTVQVYDVNIKNKVFLNIRSVEALIAVVLLEALRPTAIRNAAVYGAASLLGVAFLPAGIAAVLMGPDHAVTLVAMGLEKVYTEIQMFLGKIGRITSANRGTRTIKATISSNSVTVKLTGKGDRTEIMVSARKYLLPKPQVAGGVLYQILDALKTQPVTAR